MDRIAIIGNAGGGKSTIAELLSAHENIDVTSVDDMQWGPNWTSAHESDVERHLDEIHGLPRWIVEGLGPWSSVEHRLRLTDMVVFVDMPVWTHYWLAAERQIAAASGVTARERIDGCDDLLITRRLFETIHRCDREIVPQLRALVRSLDASTVIEHITSIDELDDFCDRISARP